MKLAAITTLIFSTTMVFAQTPATSPVPQITTIDELKREYTDLQKDIAMDKLLLRDIPAFQDFLAKEQKVADLEKQYQQIEAATKKPASATTPLKK